jgi:serine/threonine protein kinase
MWIANEGNFKTELMNDDVNNWETLFDKADEDGRENSLLYALSNIETRYGKPELAGSGAMKDIIRTEDTVSGRVIAKAVLKNPDDDQIVESFLREARITARLQHPNIVPLYDMGLDEQGQPFFTMKLIQGLTLKGILDKLKKEDAESLKGYPLSKRIDIFLKVCDALAYAHSQGIAHLDLKPDNITVSTFGDVVVCDWGLAAIIGANDDMDVSLIESIDYYSKRYFTLCGEIKGTPGYMSPEQAKGGDEVKDERSDIFSLGTILYELLTLKDAIGGDDLKSVINRTIEGQVIPPSRKRPELAIPSSLEAICMKAIKVKPEERYQSVEGIIADIDAYRLGFVTEAEESSFLKQFYLLYKRNKQICLVALLLISLIVVGSLFFIESLQREKQLTAEALDHNKELAGEASSSYAEKGRKAYYRFEISKSTDVLEASLDLNPENLMALSYLSKILAVQQEFSAAHEKLLMAETIKRGRAKVVDNDLVQYYLAMKPFEAQKPLSIQQIYPIVQKHVLKDNRYIIKAQLYAWAIMHTERILGNELAEIEEDINWLLSQDNNAKITGKLKNSFKGFELDLSGNSDLVDIRSIGQLTLKTLNIRGCNIKEMALIAELPAHAADMDSFRRTNILLLDKGQEIHINSFRKAKRVFE